MGTFSRCTIVAGGVQAQQETVGTTPSTHVDITATLQAPQTAVDNKDATATFNILTAAQIATDKQFAATLAALAFISGGLTTGQTNTAITVVRNAPAGLAIVNSLLSSKLTGGFGFATTNPNGLLIASLVVTENQNQTRASPN